MSLRGTVFGGGSFAAARISAECLRDCRRSVCEVAGGVAGALPCLRGRKRSWSCPVGTRGCSKMRMRAFCTAETDPPYPVPPSRTPMHVSARRPLTPSDPGARPNSGNAWSVPNCPRAGACCGPSMLAPGESNSPRTCTTTCSPARPASRPPDFHGFPRTAFPASRPTPILRCVRLPAPGGRTSPRPCERDCWPTPDVAVRTAALLAHHAEVPTPRDVSPRCPIPGARSNSAVSRPSEDAADP